MVPDIILLSKPKHLRNVNRRKARKEAEAAGTVVGAGGADAVTDKDKDETIKKNLEEQLKTEGGSIRRAASGLSQFAQTEEDFFGFSEVSSSVDAKTAVNTVNNSSSQGYFQSVINSMLSPFDRVAADGSVRKCISIA